MGAKTGLLVYADGDVPELLRQADAAPAEPAFALMRRLYPGWEITEGQGSTRGDGVYPPEEPSTPRAGRYTVRDPSGPTRAEKEAALQRLTEAMGPPRFSSMGPDGTLVERSLS